MVFIHGGGFHLGGGDLYGNKFLVDEMQILVTLNYRLGALGGLYPLGRNSKFNFL